MAWLRTNEQIACEGGATRGKLEGMQVTEEGVRQQ